MADLVYALTEIIDAAEKKFVPFYGWALEGPLAIGDKRMNKAGHEYRVLQLFDTHAAAKREATRRNKALNIKAAPKRQPAPRQYGSFKFQTSRTSKVRAGWASGGMSWPSHQPDPEFPPRVSLHFGVSPDEGKAPFDSVSVRVEVTLDQARDLIQSIREAMRGYDNHLYEKNKRLAAAREEGVNNA